MPPLSGRCFEDERAMEAVRTLRGTRVGCMVSLASRPGMRRGRREGQACLRMYLSLSFLGFSLVRLLLFDSIGVEEIRVPYYDGYSGLG